MNSVTKVLLRCGLVAGPLFVLAFLIEGATRPDYDPIRHPVSSLALGDLGWTQTANFLVAGLLTVVFALGMWRSSTSKVGAVLVAVWGIGLVGAGLFVTDPVSGYPPGTPPMPDSPSTLGALHDGFSLAAFAALAAAQIVFGVRFARRGDRGPAAYSLISGVLFVVLFLLAGSGFSQEPGLVDFGGLFQRGAVIIGWTWLTLLAVHLLKTATRVRV